MKSILRGKITAYIIDLVLALWKNRVFFQALTIWYHTSGNTDSFIIQRSQSVFCVVKMQILRNGVKPAFSLRKKRSVKTQALWLSGTKNPHFAIASVSTIFSGGRGVFADFRTREPEKIFRKKKRLHAFSARQSTPTALQLTVCCWNCWFQATETWVHTCAYANLSFYALQV